MMIFFHTVFQGWKVNGILNYILMPTFSLVSLHEFQGRKDAEEEERWED